VFAGILEGCVRGIEIYFAQPGCFAAEIARRALQVPAYAGIVILSWRYRAAITCLARQRPFLLALPALAVLSILWSIAPLRSFTTSVRLVALSLFALFFALAPRDKVLRLIWASLAVAAVLGALTAWFFPAFGQMNDFRVGSVWKGYSHSKNGFAALNAMAVLASLSVAASAPRFRLAALAIGIVAGVNIVMSFSFGPPVALACALAVVWTAPPLSRFLRQATTRALLSAGLVFALVVMAGAAYGPSVFRALGREQALTNRTAFWQALMPAVRDRAFAGYGYYAFWEYSPKVEDVRARIVGEIHHYFDPLHAHNGWLEITLDLGVVGLALLVMLNIRTLVQAIQRCILGDIDGETLWHVGIIAFLTLLCGVEPMFLRIFDYWGLSWVFYVMASVRISSNTHRLPD